MDEKLDFEVLDSKSILSSDELYEEMLVAQNEANVNVQDDDDIDWEFWGQIISDYENVSRTQSQQLSKAIQKGIPRALRGMIWQLMSKSKDVELESKYAQLLKQSSPHEKMIIKDLNRTFPKHEFFQDKDGAGQEGLFNIVKAYSIYDPEVGYCQGISFVMPDEEAFCVLVKLMKHYNMRGHFLPGMDGLQLLNINESMLFLPTPTPNTIKSLVISYVYTVGLLVTVEVYQRKFNAPLYISRKIIHIGAGAYLFFLLHLFEQWEYVVLLPASFVPLNYISYRIRLFKSMDPQTGATLGTLYFPFSCALLFGYYHEGWENDMHIADLSGRIDRLRQQVLSKNYAKIM
ncbi:8906_t:CDS:2 [Entrophospora sp. SA101]|nr:8906_t:CDS:2 [Entrophospora sp. SA101]